MKNEFYFPGGNIDHVMLTKGQNFDSRNYKFSGKNNFYNIGDFEDIFYCGNRLSGKITSSSVFDVLISDEK